MICGHGLKRLSASRSNMATGQAGITKTADSKCITKASVFVMEFYIDPGLANSQFLYVTGAPLDQCDDGSLDAEITESDD